jgi:hypothetical protein
MREKRNMFFCYDIDKSFFQATKQFFGIPDILNLCFRSRDSPPKNSALKLLKFPFCVNIIYLPFLSMKSGLSAKLILL